MIELTIARLTHIPQQLIPAIHSLWSKLLSYHSLQVFFLCLDLELWLQLTYLGGYRVIERIVVLFEQGTVKIVMTKTQCEVGGHLLLQISLEHKLVVLIVSHLVRPFDK